MTTSESPTASDNPVVAVFDRRPFPFRTLIVCFTLWLIATEILVFDQVKFNARSELLDQAARALGGSQLNIPSERPSNLSGDTSMEKL